MNIFNDIYTYIQNVIYLFNIKSRIIDGYCRSWIEYLNERVKVCILDRSIKLDNRKLAASKIMWVVSLSMLCTLNITNNVHYKSFHLIKINIYMYHENHMETTHFN